MALLEQRVCRTFMRRQDDDINAAILSPSLSSQVGGNGMVFRVTCSRKPLWREAMAADKEANQFCGPGGRKLPIGGHLGGMNRNVVRVAFDAQLIGADGQD